MKALIELSGSKGKLASLLALLTTAIVVTAWHFYASERERIVHDAMLDLSAVADLQARQIAEWRTERLADARVVRENPRLADWVGEFFRDPSPVRRTDTELWMASRAANYRYESVFLYDGGGNLRLSLNRTREDSTGPVMGDVREAIRTRAVVFGEFRRVPPSRNFDANIAIPLLRVRGEDTTCPGVFVFRVDAEDFLNPYLQTSALHSKTAESLLALSKGGDTLHLIHLREVPGAPQGTNTPPPFEPFPVPVKDHEGIVEGTDYRGHSVVAALRRIESSGWILIAKIDQEEVFAPANALGRMIAAQALGLVLLALAGIGWVWRGRQAASYRQQYIAESRISRLSRVHAMLSAINQAIVHIRNRQELLDEACRVAVTEGGFALSCIGMMRQTDGRLVIAATRKSTPGPDGPDGKFLKSLDLAEKAIRERKHFIVNRIDAGGDPEGWEARARAIGYHSAAAIPLRAGTDVLGVIALFSDEPETFDEGEVELLLELSSDLGFALEVMATRQIQRQSEEKLHGLFESDIIGIIFGDVYGNIQDANLKFLDIVGYTRQDLREGRVRWDDLTPPEYRLSDEERLQEAMKKGSCPPFEKEYLRQDGSRVPVLVGYMLVGESREHSVAFVLDLTGPKKVEQALRASELRYKALFESAHDAIFLMQGDRFIDCNARTLTMFGCTREHIIEKRPTDFSPLLQSDGTPSAAAAAARIHAVLENKPQSFEWKHTRLDGTLFDAEVALNRVDLAGEHFIQAIVRDVSARHVVEEKVRQLSRAVEQSPVSIVITDAAGTIEYVNRKFSEATGYSAAEVLGKNPRILKGGNKSPGEYRELWDTITTGREWRGEFINKRKDGSLFREYASISPVSNGDSRITHFVAVKEDVTERKALEERLRQSQKMESIGTLAGGIAHDFNNILGIVLGHSTVLEQAGDDRARRASSVQAVQKAVERGASLVRQILTFARKTEILVEPVSVNEIIGELVRMMQETFPRTISFRADLDPQSGAIEGDRTQLHQTFLNLCVNARDAMPSGGSLSITTNSIGGKAVRRQFPEATGTRYVHCSVADTGSGMDEGTRLRIFEPFFTTKDPGKGTGLGLAVVHGIVRSHGGFIGVDSTPGKGSTFHLYFPVPEGNVHVKSDAEGEKAETPGGTETVLIVEDEEALRELLRMLLMGKGYSVITANDGHEGVQRYREMQEEISLVVSDIGLPGLDGTGAYRQMKEINPAVRVILASGFLEPKSRAEMAAAGVRGFVHKPYSSGEILRKIREVLDAR